MNIKNALLASSLVLSVLLMSGCGSDDAKAPHSVQSTEQEPAQTQEKEQVKEDQQVFVDESKFEGEEQELVKLLNLSTKYRNEGDQAAYMDLVSDEPNTPINQMNSKKIADMQIDSIGEISESQGTIIATVTTEGSTPGSTMYIFHKTKGVWKIYDID
ncbi:hypothetical protein SAMN05428961_11448 [Paenibacillus sp. OK060]|uniref:hypothetical protein n=1 Tax=Paenibacillus sp. OK060 TaxID=1881034 RepID=UPI00087F943E|nr:hypothetical protein [Paenibacillus sp. OK060]SDM33628.1 hypothetical protein SAMN05428961_11448 [Paenibacillus sp. OK060]